MGLSIHDELITLNLMIEKSSQPTLYGDYVIIIVLLYFL